MGQIFLDYKVTTWQRVRAYLPEGITESQIDQIKTEAQDGPESGFQSLENMGLFPGFETLDETEDWMRLDENDHNATLEIIIEDNSGDSKTIYTNE
jgi:hypothetical protein